MARFLELRSGAEWLKKDENRFVPLVSRPAYRSFQSECSGDVAQTVRVETGRLGAGQNIRKLPKKFIPKGAQGRSAKMSDNISPVHKWSTFLRYL
jgi:hypothetical protein